MENSLTSKPQDDARLTKLIGYFEESEEATQEARRKAERDRDYYDGKQWTADEAQKLEARGQPVICFNKIKGRVEFYLGMEKRERRDPKAYYRNQPDQLAADSFTAGLRFAVLAADYSTKRTEAWKNMVVEGYGGVELYAEKDKIDYALKVNHIPWDRIIFDPHSCRGDFSDARYLGQVLWMDLDEALEKYGEDKRPILEATVARYASRAGETFDDKPKWTVWADPKRNRVRVVAMWHKENGRWFLCEFTQGGELAYQESPYLTQDGETICPIILESSHVDRDNNRYGEVRHMIDPQDEVNKRRSKMLHNSVSRGVIAEAGAVEDVNKTRKELARPDFFVEVMRDSRFEVVDGMQVAAGQAALYESATQFLSETGANDALAGRGVGGQSGKAIEAQQSGGETEKADQLDILRRMDQRVFQTFAHMMQQLWTAARWVRVTDDPMSPKSVGLNVPLYVNQMTGEEATEKEWAARLQDPASGIDPSYLQPAIDERTGQPKLDSAPAEMDVDIMIDDAPPMTMTQGDAFESLLKTVPLINDPATKPAIKKMLLRATPALTASQKAEVIEAMEEVDPQQAQMQQAQMAAVQERSAAEVENIKAQAFQRVAQGEAAVARSAQPPQIPVQGQVIAA